MSETAKNQDQLAKDIERQEKELSRLLDWISKADAKAQILIGAAFAMIAAVLALAPQEAKKEVLPIGLIAIACLLPVFALYECFSAAMPHIKGPADSLIFFVPMARRCKFNQEGLFKDRIDFARGLPGYEEAVQDRTDQDYLADLNAQCLINATIADAKFRRIGRAWFLLASGAVVWIVIILALYRGYSGKEESKAINNQSIQMVSPDLKSTPNKASSTKSTMPMPQSHR